MDEFEKQVMKLFIDSVKGVGGRGPKNVSVKVHNQTLDLNFWLLKSSFESFLFTEIQGGKTILADIYEKIATYVSAKPIISIGESLKMDIEYIGFNHDMDQDKYSLHFKIKSRA